MGVLQRISLCYAATALLQNRLSERALLGVAIAVLVLYWPLTLVPIPDGTGTNLWKEGTNFVSWFDRVALGSHRWVEGPTGYDTEGLLSTLPALAQCLLGVVAGRWFVGHAKSTAHLVRFALLGGSIVDANALLRAYIWHCIAIPLIASIFMALHFWRVRKDGGISGPAPVMLESEIKEEKGHRPVILRPSGLP